MRHTPGPWVHYDDRNDGKTHRHEIAGMGKTICHIYHSVPHQDAANARLIAAAPELLEALRTVHRVLQGEQVMDIMLTEQGPILGNVIRDAIDKAISPSTTSRLQDKP